LTGFTERFAKTKYGYCSVSLSLSLSYADVSEESQARNVINFARS